MNKNHYSRHSLKSTFDEFRRGFGIGWRKGRGFIRGIGQGAHKVQDTIKHISDKVPFLDHILETLADNTIVNEAVTFLDSLDADIGHVEDIGNDIFNLLGKGIDSFSNDDFSPTYRAISSGVMPPRRITRPNVGTLGRTLQQREPFQPKDTRQSVLLNPETGQPLPRIQTKNYELSPVMGDTDTATGIHQMIPHQSMNPVGRVPTLGRRGLNVRPPPVRSQISATQ